MDDQSAFRDYVTAWLASTRRSAASLGEEAGIDQSLLSKYLHARPDKRVRPSPKNLRKLAPVLGVPYETLMRQCGYLPAEHAAQPVDPVQAELDARIAHLGVTLGQYPRAFWLAVVEAAERMARIGEALPQLPVTAPGQSGFTAAKRRVPKDHHGGDGQLPNRYRGVPRLLLAAR